MEIQRKIIEIDEERCDGCGQCVMACAEGAIEIIDGKARLVKDSYCDDLGACLGECPQDALRMIERKAEPFDHAAVEEHLKRKDAEPKHPFPSAMGGCPSAQMRFFHREATTVADALSKQDRQSALGHWPVQIRLVPPNAPFLKGADLLVAADCAPLAYPDFHEDFLQGKAVMIGCPKLDNTQEYVAKFTEIFRSAGIRSVTVVDMEVPCCSALPRIVQKAMELAQEKVPMEEVIIGVTGKIIKKKNLAA